MRLVTTVPRVLGTPGRGTLEISSALGPAPQTRRRRGRGATRTRKERAPPDDEEEDEDDDEDSDSEEEDEEGLEQPIPRGKRKAPAAVGGKGKATKR